MVMMGYSLLLTVVAVVMAPRWLYRVTAEDRAWLRLRVSGLPEVVKATVRGKRVIWVHAVSVGEVLAATRLIAELEAALGGGGSLWFLQRRRRDRRWRRRDLVRGGCSICRWTLRLR